MRYLVSRRWAIFLLALTPLVVSLSCGPVRGEEPPADPADSQAPGDELTLETEVDFGPGDFILPDTKAGLSDLLSYSATLTMSFDGTREGSRQQWSKTYGMLVSTTPPARQLDIEKTGDIEGTYPAFMAEVDGAAYERLEESACTATVMDQENSLGERLEPAGFLTGVHGAEQAGSETLNDVAVDHYAFDERALGQLDVAQSTGEIWVASGGGFIVRYLLTTEGNADFFGDGIEGTLTWQYELSDVNQPVTIELPADCPAGMVDAPQLQDASNVLNLPGMLTYDTPSSLADAAAFYQVQIPALGWEPLGEPAITETTALLDFAQGDQKMTVIITAGDGGTKVHIVLGRSQE